jgi:hypothetical protein
MCALYLSHVPIVKTTKMLFVATPLQAVASLAKPYSLLNLTRLVLRSDWRSQGGA